MLITEPPTALAVSLDSVKEHLGIYGTLDDTRVTSLIKAATIHYEKETGFKLVPQSWSYTLCEFPNYIKLPFLPLNGDPEITYFDADNEEQDLEDFYLDYYEDRPSKIYPLVSWPQTYERKDAITVTAEYGYDTVPDDIQQVLRELVSYMNENREGDGKPPTNIMRFIGNRRIWHLK